jgi:fatty acid desaturase
MSANPTTPVSRPDEIAPGEHHWTKVSRDLRHRLNRAIPHDVLKELHRKRPARHLAIAARQFLILIAASAAAWNFPQPWIWIPAAVISGWTVFNFTVLLHEALHHAVFNGPHPRGDRFLSLLYAIPSGISASQFTRWHLTHHAELGDAEADPKRHYLSPKINKPWYKLLYFTPALFPIYFRAARRESSTYPEPLQRAIARERKLSMLFHLSALALIWYGFGFYAALRASIIPVFFIFPIAFTLNRLGQHYDIDPADPAKWGTLMRGHWFWDFVYLNSNYHLEHHYFPGVPFYRLPEVQRALLPFYAKKNMRWRTYGELIYGWLVENQAPHTNWDGERIPDPSSLIPNP